MPDYHAKRAELIGLLSPMLKADLVQQGYPDTPALDHMVLLRLETELNEFEMHVVHRHQSQQVQARPPKDGWWRGVWQSAVGSGLFIILAVLLDHGFKEDWFGRLYRWSFGPQ